MRTKYEHPKTTTITFNTYPPSYYYFSIIYNISNLGADIKDYREGDMDIKDKIIRDLFDEGWLPDEAERRVEEAWWIIDKYLKIQLESL